MSALRPTATDGVDPINSWVEVVEHNGRRGAPGASGGDQAGELDAGDSPQWDDRDCGCRFDARRNGRVWAASSASPFA